MIFPSDQATILLIGDPADVRATRAEGLRLQGYQVLTAAHGWKAEAIGQRFGLEPLALVILALQRAHAPAVREGYALVQRWGAQAPRLPFIVISDDHVPSRLDLPVVWWLATPLTPDTLLMAVRDILGS
jgi:DNA-binding response OmpR family regulator